MNEQYIQCEEIKAFGTYNNCQNRLKSATITESDKLIELNAQDLIDNE